MPARIARNLNFVIGIDTDSDATGMVYLHSTPIGRETYEQFFFVLSKTFAAIISNGLGQYAGPPVAYLMLKRTAEGLDEWDAVQRGLVNEIIRLTNVAYTTAGQGWQQIPLELAFTKGILTEDDRHEVLGQLVFFTLVVRLMRKGQNEEMMEAAGGLWGSQLTSLPFTEFLSSLPTSTPTASTGETVSTSSVPR